MELLPAPFGPMMARTSRSRTSNETSCSALTPPNASDTPSTDKRTSPMRGAVAWTASSGALIGSRRLCRRRGGERLGRPDLEIGREDSGAAILVFHLGLHVHHVPLAVERFHEEVVLLADETPTHFARARELAVVGIELLVQDQEAMDLRIGELRIRGEVGIDPLDAFPHQIVHLVARSEVGIAGIRHVSLLGPVAHCFDVEVDERARLVAPVAEAD